MSKLFTLPEQTPIDAAGQPIAGAKANFYLTESTTRADTYSDAGLTTPNDNPVVADANGVLPAIYLDPDVTYRCILTDDDDVQIFDVDPVAQPQAAGEVVVTDSGEYFTATTLNGILQEIGAGYSQKAADETISGIKTHSTYINMTDNEIRRPMLRDIAYKTVPVTSSSGTATLNLEAGNSFTLTLSENTTIAINSPPASDDMGEVIVKIVQDSSPRTVSWPSGTKWPGGTAPTISTTSGAEDIVILRTWDGGTTWYGNFAQAYAEPA